MTWPICSVAEANAILTAPGAPFEMRTQTVAGRSVRTYLAAPPNMREVIDASRSWGGREFLVYQDERITFDAHWRAVQAFGRVLVQKYGVAKGDRVAVAMRNFPEWSVAAFAAVAIGAIFVPLNAWETGKSLAKMIGGAGRRSSFLIGSAATTSPGWTLRRSR